jgi:DNA-binding transcriptional ArsR family regulator
MSIVTNTRNVGGFWETSLQRVLMFLAGNPEAEFYDREVSAKSGISRSAANYALRRLAALGWVSAEKKGRMVFYRASLENPVIRQIKVLDTVIRLKPGIARLAPLAERITLYGSAAEGRDLPDSDIDLLILSNRPEEARKRASGFPRKCQVLVHEPVAWAGLAKQKPVFFNEVERGIVLWRR